MKIGDYGIIIGNTDACIYFHYNDLLEIIDKFFVLCKSINNNYKKDTSIPYVGYWINKEHFKVLDKEKNPEYFL